MSELQVSRGLPQLNTEDLAQVLFICHISRDLYRKVGIELKNIFCSHDCDGDQGSSSWYNSVSNKIHLPQVKYHLGLDWITRNFSHLA